MPGLPPGKVKKLREMLEPINLWDYAACGGHSNRYGEDDNVWDCVCVHCADRKSALNKLAKAIKGILDGR